MIRNNTLLKPRSHSEEGLGGRIRLNIHNRFSIEVTDSSTGKLKQRAKAENVVLSQYYPNLNDNNLYILIGKGTGVPSESDTDLFSRIDYLHPSAQAVDYSHLNEGYISQTFSAVASETQYVGEIITEIGLSRSNTAITHAMLEDMNGNPISITKTETDIITFYATIFVRFSTEFSENNNVLISKRVIHWGIEFPELYATRYTSYTMYYSANSTLYVSNESTVAQVSTYEGSVEKKSSSKGFKYTAKFSRVGASQGNFAGGIFGAHFGSSHAVVGYSHPLYCVVLPKGLFEVTGEAVGTGDGSTKNFRTTFDFPVEATVYIDGVPQVSGVTVVPDRRYGLLNYFVSLNPESSKAGVFAYGAEANNSYSGRKDSANDGETLLYLNTRTEYVQISSFSGTTSAQAKLSVSNDLEVWHTLGSFSSGSVAVPEDYSRYKYWKITNNGTGSWAASGVNGVNLTGYHIRFDEPPKAGSVITIDYKTPMIPKDSNHVLDCFISVVIGEDPDG